MRLAVFPTQWPLLFVLQGAWGWPDSRELSNQTLHDGLTSVKFKQEVIRLFRSERYARSTALDIGAGTGATSAALAVNFGLVVGTEVFWDIGREEKKDTAKATHDYYRLDSSKLFKRDGRSFSNILALHLDAKLPFALSVLVEQNISAVVIDAQHDFFNVVGETMSVLRYIPCCVETIVYHDYCMDEVYQAIRYFADAG
ncbi:Uncharacterized protein SCF082_LOCUS34728, partial [Durusdinium trenchii]